MDKATKELLLLWGEFEKETEESRKMKCKLLNDNIDGIKKDSFFKANFSDFVRWLLTKNKEDIEKIIK